MLIWIDYIIIGIVLISALISLVRGFMREALSLASWIVAIWVSWSFFRELAIRLEPWVATPSLRLAIAFSLLMMLTLLLGALVNFLMGQLIERTGLTGTDRMIGFVFGGVRGALIVSVLVLLAGLTAVPQDAWWQQSLLIGYFQEVALWLQGFLPADVADMFNYA